ncbi:DUF6527 family protein [Modestobacter caceresii]|uniref:DUF6527 family protein n=1 Tax=Modestobacter caceresii TaxID=1522368 RepID=UPI00068F6289|nr:DUF6527 family protein [Modestobacter caceresii]
MKSEELESVFVEYVPTALDDGLLYVSMEYATASHRCACGCGVRVVTPLGPADWTLTFDGRVTLSPSVGNGQFPCGSHYLIRQNKVVWCRPMTRDAALATHKLDAAQRAQTYGDAPRAGVLTKLSRWLRRFLGRS